MSWSRAAAKKILSLTLCSQTSSGSSGLGVGTLLGVVVDSPREAKSFQLVVGQEIKKIFSFVWGTYVALFKRGGLREEFPHLHVVPKF